MGKRSHKTKAVSTPEAEEAADRELQRLIEEEIGTPASRAAREARAPLRPDHSMDATPAAKKYEIN